MIKGWTCATNKWRALKGLLIRRPGFEKYFLEQVRRGAREVRRNATLWVSSVFTSVDIVLLARGYTRVEEERNIVAL